MEIDQNFISEKCGIKPLNIENVDVGNNPEYVFVADPKFNPINLYDIEGNTVIVNSWIECAHYIQGGWNNTITQVFPGEQYIIYFSTTGIVIYYLSKLLVKNLKITKSND